MAAREITCRGCGVQVFEIMGYWNNTLVVDRGKVEIAVHVPQADAYTVSGGFKIHKCKKEP